MVNSANNGVVGRLHIIEVEDIEDNSAGGHRAACILICERKSVNGATEKDK